MNDNIPERPDLQFCQQKFNDLQEERKKILDEIFNAKDEKSKAPSVQLQKLGDIERKVRHLVEQGNLTHNFLKKKVADNVWRIVHNVVLGSRNTSGFEVEYTHSAPVKDGDFWEIRIDDLGEHFRKEQSYYDIGLGLINTGAKEGKNREDYGFDIGVVSNHWKLVEFEQNDKRNRREWSDCVLINGDIVKFSIKGDKIIMSRNGRYHCEFAFDNSQQYSAYVGMNCHFEKVTFAYNKSFGHQEVQERFPKEDVRVFVTTMNEGSPRYNEGVKDGGKHLVKDGYVIRDLKENGMNLLNFQPGYESCVYDTKLGGDFHLEDALPSRLMRNRFPFNGNMITITHRQGREGVYNVHVKNFSDGHESTFVGTDAEWQQGRRDFLSYGDKYVMELPKPQVMTKPNDMMFAGIKCKNLNNNVYNTLRTRVQASDKTPAVVLLGSDRSQTLGSMSGAFRAYEDLCCVFLDAHFNFRDPHMNREFGITHGSPHFLLFQKNLREAVKKWEESDDEYKQHPDQQGKRQAIKFFRNQTGGDKYWENLKDNEGYPGFNWLQQQNHKINHRRVAFVGVRDKEAKNVMVGKGLRSPLDNLFTEMLRLEKCMYTRDYVRDHGVPKTWERIIKQFRASFDQEYLEKKDKECKDGKWVPPIMVSWDVDSIDPRDCPCVMRQEAHGLSSEECMSFADEFARTEKLVFWETVEFNPDLWAGYRDERVDWTINEYELGSYHRRPRQPTNENQHRMDRDASTKLIQETLRRAFAKQHHEQGQQQQQKQE